MSSHVDILTRQSEIVDRVKAINANFKKDGKTRKITLEYHDERLKKLESYWQEFESNNLRLHLYEEKLSEPYYQQRVFEKLQVIYNETKDMILTSKQQLEQNLKQGYDEKSEEAGPSGGQRHQQQEMSWPNQAGEDVTNLASRSGTHDKRTQEMLCEQKSNVKALERAIRNLDLNQVTQKWQLEDKLKTISQRWENYDKLYWKLDNILVDMENYEREYNDIEQLYEQTKTLINTKIWTHHHQEKSAPRIELPVFHGNYSQWTTFKDLFTETVHLNTFISSAQKMQHLKSKLKGEAERLVQHLSISASNYETCWSILQQRYDNKRLLFSYHANELLNQPSVQQSSAMQLKRMHDTTLENLNAISNLNIETSNWDPLLVHMLLQKLDKETTQDFIESLNNPRDIPNLKEFLGFLENKFTAMESSVKTNRSSQERYQNINNSPPAKFGKFSSQQKYFNKNEHSNNRNMTKSFYHAAAAITCPRCTQQHGLYNCPEFINMTPRERHQTATQLGVCINCLFSHNGKECTSNKSCKQCNKKHNTLIHDAIINNEHGKLNRGQRVTTHLLNDEQNEVFLATAKIRVKTSLGTYTILRALIDQGSQVSLITEDATQRLNLKRSKLDAVISGIGASTSNKCKGVVQLSCKALDNNFTFTTEALIMNSLTNKLPNKTINRETFLHLEQIKLADPEFNVSGNIDVLLGADVYSEILMEGLIKTTNSNILAQQTHLGWIICGRNKTFQCNVTINNMEEIAKFWEQEEIQESSQQTEQQNNCETFYKQTTTRLADGRYQVRLPLKPEIDIHLGTSKKQAVAQFKQLEHRMRSNSDIADQYVEFMKEYESMGHMKICQNSNNTNKLEYFMPHHGVIRSNSLTTKLRVVFNASATTSSKRSLNDLMESGPNLQADLQSILLQWRQYRYVYTADIEKMYRFIAMHPEDQTLQKIIWRESPHHRLNEFQLTTVTYGTKAAPFLALRTLRQLADDEGGQYPAAKPILLEQFFMDDAIFGAHSLIEARKTRDELILLLRQGGFNLRKWASNEPCLVEDLSQEMRNPQAFNFTEAETSKTLGLSWNPVTDEFIFLPTSIPETSKQTKTPTKRQVLSEISTLFDPLGWLSPITVKCKILFQQLWKNKLQWDDNIPDDIQREWATLRTELTNMPHFTIKRWLGITEIHKHTELFAFCDASEKAYACVVYSVQHNEYGEYSLNIIAAKTKVAPLQKQQTLPRLELCSAQLLAKLVYKIQHSLKQNIRITAWTDSMVVLGWINGDINRWNAYVANRVREIITTVPAINWKHIRSENNPADCSSRGLLPSQLKEFALWWNGPNKTIFEQQPKNYITNIEEKKILTVSIKIDETIITCLLNKHSSLSKTVRTIAWVLHFITSARAQQQRSSMLTLEEIRRARNIIIKHTQQKYFIQEISDLRTKGMINKKSSLLKLNPFLDGHGMLRVGGRLNNTYLSDSAKHPLIIPSASRLTELLIDETHLTTLHGGARLTLTTLRQQYWVIGGQNTVKKQLRRCVKCCRYKNQKHEQLMGDLPSARTTPSPTFYHTGVDLTGYVDVRMNKGRGVRTSKGYVVVFVCMATKAIHLELVTDLTTPTFLLALKRMIARRGCPRHIYSDNGTNFVGADRELQKQLKQLLTMNNDICQREFNNLGLQWHFNAPSWPSAGGIWEAAVRQMKYHLKRVLGEQKLTYEEFLTLLTQIEACLNSRPLCLLTEDTEDLECLTPGHFLTGRPLVSLPEENLCDSPISLNKRWKLVEQMHQQFWKKWSSEYLQELQVRSKWHRKTKNLTQGDVVLIKEENLPPARWALGRVQNAHPGKDGLVRVVTLKTKDGCLKRPITKLVLLPIENRDENADSSQEKTKYKKQTTKKNHPRTGNLITNILCIFLTFLTLFQPSSQTDDFINISLFQENKPIYFDNIAKLQSIHDNWKIVIYYNMTSYWQGVNNIQYLIDHVEKRCNEFSYKYICNSITSELKQQFKDLQENNYLLKSSSRTKRGLINGIGYVANSLFGVLDQRFAEKYKNDIETLHMNEHHLLTLIKNQTSILEAHNNIIKRNEQTMNHQFQLIEKHLNLTNQYLSEFQDKLKIEENISYFNIMALSANMILSKLLHMQQMFIDTITNIHHGRIDPQLLSQEQLRRELNLISTQIPKHLSLPIDNIQDKFMNIYKLLEVKWRVLERYFILEITLPLTSDHQFNLYKPIPIPQLSNNKTVTLNILSEYIAVNIRKEMYMILSEKDLSMCTNIDTDNMICTFNNPTLNMRNNEVPCEISLLTHTRTTTCTYIEDTCSNKWIALHKANNWLYFCCEECLLRIICEEHMTSRSVKSAGVIKAGQGCLIKHEEATFYTKMVYQNRININTNIDIPISDQSDINNITTKLLKKPSIININTKISDDEINSLQKTIQLLKENSQIDGNISTHDIHQYAVSYTTLLIVMVVVVAAGFTFVHWRRNLRGHYNTNENQPKNESRTPACEQSIEMTNLSTSRRPLPRRHIYAIPNINFNV